MIWLSWLVTSWCVVASTRSPKAMEVIRANTRKLKCCWAVIGSSMPFFIPTLLFDYLPLCMHTVFFSILLLCLSVCVWLLLLTCRHMLPVNISSLPLWWIPTWCFGRRWTSINIIHLTWTDTDYFKVEQPKWIVIDMSIQQCYSLLH